MATIAELLERLHQQLEQVGPAQPLRALLATWPSLATGAGRVLGALHQASDLGSVLRALRGERDSAPEYLGPLGPAGRTLGAIADVLAGERAAVMAARTSDKARLAIQVRAALYRCATATLSAGGNLDQAPVLWRELTELAERTEFAVLIPIELRHSGLDMLTSHASTGHPGDSLQSLLCDWESAAVDAMRGTTNVGGFALQSAAATISLICLSAASALPSEVQVSLPLHEAWEAWRRTAAWPADLRLVGRSVELSRASSLLAQVLIGGTALSMDANDCFAVMLGALRCADSVAENLVQATRRVVTQGQLWVSIASLSPRTRELYPTLPSNGWIPEPARRDSAGERLIQNCEGARLILSRGVAAYERSGCTWPYEPFGRKPVREQVPPVRSTHTEPPAGQAVAPTMRIGW